MAYLPGKKIIFLIIFILLIFAGWFYYAKYEKGDLEYLAKKEEAQKILTVATTTENGAMYESDTDGDGLKDWEETLWKTDPNKKDTDGDGAEDNEEIAQNRNPLKAGPDDKIGQKEDLIAQNKSSSGADLNTMTAAYAKQFLTEYLLIKQQKGELTNKDKESLVESLMLQMSSNRPTDTYNVSNIKIADNGQENLRKYSITVKKLLVDDKKIKENEVVIFGRLMENLKNKEGVNYSNDVKKLLEITEIYNGALAELRQLDVPEELAKDHLDLINGLNNMSEAVKLMATAPEDSIKGLLGYRIYKQEVEKFSGGFESVKEILVKKNVF
ncbi:MAG: thrombospondin type 3 repeat-containing protein [Candidatus Pacebacteria bacterium]|nr:thrombospondin type 3 repeat-containing protein [Candidatus Paceibacterota bacterium]NUQ56878.1 hypothetical protein [Candidatus Paceibacter sp.]